MKRTTIRLSDELYEQLRRDAANKKTSVAEVIRLRISPNRGRTIDPLMKIAGICTGPVLSTKIDGKLYG